MKQLFNRQSNDDHNFWMSYTDLMSGFLIIFIIISVVMFKHDVDKKEKFNEWIHVVDSLKGANLKNLIFEYECIFKSNNDIYVNFDEIRGSIILTCVNKNRYLFKSNSDQFESELKCYLDSIRKPLIEKTMALWKEKRYKNVELRIEGHADPNGKWPMRRGGNESFLYNLDLSSRRAYSVYRFLMDDAKLSNEQVRFMKMNMISVGYSFSHRVIEDNMDNESLDATSRRIEFRIISK